MFELLLLTLQQLLLHMLLHASPEHKCFVYVREHPPVFDWLCGIVGPIKNWWMLTIVVDLSLPLSSCMHQPKWHSGALELACAGVKSSFVPFVGMYWDTQKRVNKLR